MSVFIVTPSDSDLMHHGIKGQRWGIRRYQNKDGSLTPLGKRRSGSEDSTFDSQRLLSTTALTTSNGRSSRSGSRSSTDDDWTVEGEPKGYKSSNRKKKDFVEGTWKEVDDGKTNERKSDGERSEDEKSDRRVGMEQGLKSTQEALSGVSKITGVLAEQQSKRLQSDRQRAIKEMDVSNMSDDDLQKAINRMTRENKYKELKADRIEYGRQKTIKRLKLIGDVAATGGTIVGVVAAIKKAKG